MQTTKLYGISGYSGHSGYSGLQGPYGPPIGVFSSGFTGSSTYTFTHNFGYREIVTNIYDTSWNQIGAGNVTLIDDNSFRIDFSSSVSGYVVAVCGTSVSG